MPLPNTKYYEDLLRQGGFTIGITGGEYVENPGSRLYSTVSLRGRKTRKRTAFVTELINEFKNN